jgi:hypothetical protein
MTELLSLGVGKAKPSMRLLGDIVNAWTMAATPLL